MGWYFFFCILEFFFKTTSLAFLNIFTDIMESILFPSISYLETQLMQQWMGEEDTSIQYENTAMAKRRSKDTELQQAWEAPCGWGILSFCSLFISSIACCLAQKAD